MPLANDPGDVNDTPGNTTIRSLGATLLTKLVSNAFALTVAVFVKLNGPVYARELVVGRLPSKV